HLKLVRLPIPPPGRVQAAYVAVRGSTCQRLSTREVARAACNIRAMAKPPSKRGSGRGKSGARDGKPATTRNTGKRAGTKLPGWMPEPPPKPAPAGRKPAKTGKPAHRSGRAATGPGGKPAARAGLQDPHAAREASRYENPIASREAILQLLVDADGPQSAEALAERLQLTAPDRFDALGKRLA